MNSIHSKDKLILVIEITFVLLSIVVLPLLRSQTPPLFNNRVNGYVRQIYWMKAGGYKYQFHIQLTS